MSLIKNISRACFILRAYKKELTLIERIRCSLRLRSISYDFAVTLKNLDTNKTAHITASFYTSSPTPQDWKEWMVHWAEIGYCINSKPFIYDTFNLDETIKWTNKSYPSNSKLFK